MVIRKLGTSEEAPMDLLLLADPSSEHLLEYLYEGDCFVAESDNTIVGVYVLLEIMPNTVELMNVIVMENMHGKGIGKQLVKHAIEVAQSAGYAMIVVGTGNSSIGPLALYQKCGFRITGVDKDFFITHYPDEIYENGIQCRDMIRLALEL